MNRDGRDARHETDAMAARWVARRDAGLSEADSLQLQQWLDADPRHRAAFEFHASTWAALRPSETGALSAIEGHLLTLRRLRTRRRRMIAMAGAAAAILALTFRAWQRDGSELDGARIAVVLPARQSLPDGSNIELKGDAQIEVSYTSALRRVDLARGEAYFAVQHDPMRPFVVFAGGIEVKAVGTAFSVQLESAEIAVLVTDGRVAVARAAPESLASAVAPGEVALVEAGRRAIVDTSVTAAPPEVIELPPAELQERLAWRSPRLEFTRTPLSEAVTLLNRHAPAGSVRLEVADARAADMRISGVFRADNADAFVMLLEGAFGISSERAGNTIALRSAAANP